MLPGVPILGGSRTEGSSRLNICCYPSGTAFPRGFMAQRRGVSPQKERTQGGHMPWDWMLLSKKPPGLGDFSSFKYHFFCFSAAGELQTLI